MSTTNAPAPAIPHVVSAILHALPQLVWIERIDTRAILYANAAFGAYFGSDAGQRAAAVARIARLPAQSIDDRPMVHDIIQEMRLCRQDGARRWHKVNVQPFYEAGLLIGQLCSAEDVDELHTSRQSLADTVDLLRLSQEAAGAGLFDFRVEAGAAVLSPESARQHGLRSDRPAVIGFRDWLRRVHGGDRAKALGAMKAAVAGHGTFDVAFRVRLHDGGLRWIQSIGRSFYDTAGALTRITGLSLDISARKEAEAALIEAKSAAETARLSAEKANAAKTEFLSTMSHEIRTPLNAVIGFAGLIANSQRLDPDLQHYADLVRASGENLLSVVNDILDFSSVEAGAVCLRRQAFSLEALVEGSIALVCASASGKALHTGMILDAKLPALVIGDEGRLRQVLLNLLNNAIKFTQRGSITVSLRHEGGMPGGERVRFSVADTGIGIAHDKQASLFERFYQVDGSMRRDHGGTGLGLAISKGLIERMGGQIGVNSRLGHGSTFWFTVTLPVAETEQDLAAPRQSAAPVARANILLVEDIDVNRELGCIMLRAAGHRVEVAENGFAAVRAVESGHYDLVLMDIQMPGMDGMMATRLIRCLPGPCARVPIVALTANVLPDQVRAFREAGLDDHLGKPFSSADLETLIARWLSPGSAPDSEDPDASPPACAAELAPLPEHAIDRERFEDNLALLPPESLKRLLERLRSLIEESFVEEPADLAARDRLRGQAHALAAAAGLIGFSALSTACATLDSFDEAQIRAQGRPGFDIALSRVRALAASAVFETRRLIATMTDGARPALAMGA